MTEQGGLLNRLDDALLDGPGGEAEAVLIYAAREIEQLSPNDPMPSCLRALADVLVKARTAFVGERPSTPDDLGACLGAMRAVAEVCERETHVQPERVLGLLMPVLDVLGAVHSAYPLALVGAIGRFGVANDNQEEERP
jgi:hypothetical protein